MLHPAMSEMKLLVPDLNASTFEVWEWMSDLILHFIMDVITYLSCD